MKLLVLGGTVFLGRHVVSLALERGHDVTLFNRGRSAPHLFPQATHLKGDRQGNLALLEEGTWDAAIDLSGYLPHTVAASSRALADRVEHLTFVSSISVYASFETIGQDEDAPLAELQGASAIEVTGQTYGPLKALCERAAEEALPGRVLTVRPGLLAGPYDPTNRFSWWVKRLSQGGTVLAPGSPERLVQLIDARDLATWMLDMAQRRATGTFNAVGPAEPTTMADVLEACRAAANSGAELVWVPDAALLEAGIQPWSQLPLWIPDLAEPLAGFLRIDSRRAMAQGLTFRPLTDTARDILAALEAEGEPPRSELAPRAPG
ncbi:MAG: NAD-dependent epimerase/dehydratase family protein, partial [Actinomycetota bacterium]|nr:NAD-dependent epimerase/dehydratase family protein [Actinomycetota bacterium]